MNSFVENLIYVDIDSSSKLKTINWTPRFEAYKAYAFQYLLVYLAHEIVSSSLCIMFT